MVDTGATRLGLVRVQMDLFYTSRGTVIRWPDCLLTCLHIGYHSALLLHALARFIDLST